MSKSSWLRKEEKEIKMTLNEEDSENLFQINRFERLKWFIEIKRLRGG